jgi:hypothetical protein
MEHPLPTPPRSPAPCSSKDFYKEEIKSERLSPVFGHLGDEDFFLSENPFEDFWGIDEVKGDEVGGGNAGLGRKRKLSELLNMDMEQFLRGILLSNFLNNKN